MKNLLAIALVGIFVVLGHIGMCNGSKIFSIKLNSNIEIFCLKVRESDCYEFFIQSDYFEANSFLISSEVGELRMPGSEASKNRYALVPAGKPVRYYLGDGEIDQIRLELLNEEMQSFHFFDVEISRSKTVLTFEKKCEMIPVEQSPAFEFLNTSPQLLVN